MPSDEHRESIHQRHDTSYRLSPIVPIVLYNGKQRWTAERQFRKLLGHEDMFGSELLNFEYLLIDVARYTECERRCSDHGLRKSIG
ncbi:Rpn family recombination-promoting nuclease/putative transposase [Paenibacillus sabuli]|uniref:Rpn family recombination-promoting nuclease/putative transposase n=1 Tax=Paenibacillus sabuli TaxID=2772509 RepID=UPI001CC31BD0|nr:Rpn family recombination-promoting nuclease/putative transposase [Paenibacillus sabuli]